MHQTRRIPIVDLNDYLTCKLCKGYFIDATTIIECLHTFCRSCIVRYLEKNKYCPVCDVQVHKTKPLLNIRPDKTLQDIVYKLVPRLFQNEMCRRREFYAAHSEARPSNLEQCGEASYQHILSPDETICLSLNYHGNTGPPRYLRCPAAVSVVHLQKLLRNKYDLTEHHRVDILHNQDCLNSHLTLMDIAYIYLWRRKGPLELTYRIYESTTKKTKVETPTSLQTASSTTTLSSSLSSLPIEQQQSIEDASSVAQDKSKNEWKEVQLRISENGEMCITGVDDSIILNEQVTKCNSSSSKNEQSAVVTTPLNDAIEKACSPEVETKAEVDPVQSKSLLKKDVPALKLLGKETTTTTTSIQSTIAPIKNNAIAVTVSTSNNGKPSVATSVTTVVTTSNNSSSCTTATMGTTIISTTASLITTSTITCSSITSIATTSTTTTTINSLNDRQLGIKHKMQNHSEDEPVAKQPKQTILNHSLGIHNLSNNHPLKRHSQIRKSTENISSTSSESKHTTCTISNSNSSCTTASTNSVPSSSMFGKQTIINKQINNNNNNNNAMPMRLNTSQSQKWPPNRTPATNLPCYAPKTNYNPVINVPKVQASTTVSRMDQKITVSSSQQSSASASSSLSSQQPATILNNKMPVKSKSNNPVGYKTLRDPPKTWNPQISRASLLKSPDPKYGDLKNVRPAKFFKIRNNMPRYLGNPASGVKPLYQVHNSPEKDKSPETISKPDNKTESIKKHSIVKIDPKTLKPISEKAPEVSNLSNQTTTADLKINTSSVPIFNPLKLQSSPKSERKSPKSPQSPKPKSSSSPPSKREKINLNYTPPNPFIPNLTSPTLSPNQFLYPPGPPGFPTYDPRIMAAYHSLLYGQRMPYPPSPLPGLSLDLNQRKSFDLPAPTSPKVPALSQQFSPKGQISPKPPPPSIAETNSKPPSSPKPPTTTNMQPNSPKLLNSSNNVANSKSSSSITTKRTGKESGKNEKSLQNAVEKLTQNRVKELIKSEDMLKNNSKASVVEKAVVVTNDTSTNNQDEKVTNHNKSQNSSSNNKNVVEQQHTDNNKKEIVTSNNSKEQSMLNHNDMKQLPSGKKDIQAKKDMMQPKEKNCSKNNVSNNNNTDSVPLVTDAKKK